jgi:cytochrome c oxidase cbb3-type subunit 1
MAPYWLWRAIGGSLMWLSHLLFAYNFYVMVRKKEKIVIPRSPIDILKEKERLETQTLTKIK